MNKTLATIGRAILPAIAVIALAFVLSQFNITANAGTITTAAATGTCSGPCDPANCPMPCAKECTGVKSAACPAQMDCSKMKATKAASVQTASFTTPDCPTPCAVSCDKAKAAGCSKTVAQVK